MLLDSPFIVKQLASRDPTPIKRSLAIDEYKDNCFILIMKWYNTIRQGLNTIAQNLKCMMDKININLSGANRLQ